MTDTTDKPTIDERYTRAGNSRNLSVEEERSGDAGPTSKWGEHMAKTGKHKTMVHRAASRRSRKTNEPAGK